MTKTRLYSQTLRRGFLCAFLLLSPLHAGEWTLVQETQREAVGNGAFIVFKKVKNENESDLKMIVFDDSQCTLRVIAQKVKATTRPLSDVLREVKALVGTNGGYFDPANLNPAGLEIVSGKATGKLISDNVYYGSLAVTNGKPILLWHNEITETANFSDLVQCNPKLVDRGNTVGGLGDSTSPRALRTFIATDGAGKWALGTCAWIRLGELAKLLTTQKIIKELRVVRALNLDGGPSTGIWWRNENGIKHYDHEGWKVRNIIAVLPRQ